jgi:AcrR family transcriptional regulator
MKALQKFASVHASLHNHFGSERHLLDRQTYKQRRSAALARSAVAGTGGRKRMSRVKGRSVEETNQIILEAARKRFAKNGFSETSIEDIAADAGLTRRTIYEYFRNKEDLLECILKIEADLYVDLLKRLDGIGDPAKVLRAVFDIVFDMTAIRLGIVGLEVDIHTSINIPNEAVSVSLRYLDVVERAIKEVFAREIFRHTLSAEEFMGMVTIMVGGCFARSRTVERLVNLDTHSGPSVNRWKSLMSDMLINYLSLTPATTHIDQVRTLAAAECS